MKENDVEYLKFKAYRELGKNPFSEEYYLKELKKFDKFIKPISNDVITITKQSLPFGIWDNYMYQNMYEQKEEFPVLFIKDTLFMSLTRMEIQSHFMPIHLARGKVGVGGLGLGYYVKSILSKPTVSEVIVYETCQEVIDLYYANFGKHKKLTIIKEDVMKLKDKRFDFFYMDTYEKACDFQALYDMKKFCSFNNVTVYHFWTIEAFVQAMITEYQNNIKKLTDNMMIEVLINRYIDFLVLCEDASVKPSNYIDGEEAFEILTTYQKQ